jgi:hypothetical protein
VFWWIIYYVIRTKFRSRKTAPRENAGTLLTKMVFPVARRLAKCFVNTKPKEVCICLPVDSFQNETPKAHGLNF